MPEQEPLDTERAASGRAIGGPTLAVLVKAPFPDITGSRQRIAALLRSLAATGSLHCVTLGFSEEEGALLRAEFPQATVVVCHRRQRAAVGRLITWVKPNGPTWSGAAWPVAAMASDVTEQLRLTQAQAVWAPGPEAYEIFGLSLLGPEIPVLVDLQQIDSTAVEDHRIPGRLGRLLPRAVERRRRLRRETQVARRAQLLTVTSEQDQLHLASMASAVVVPNGCHIPTRGGSVAAHGTGGVGSGGLRLGVLGALSYEPNLVAARTLALEIVPELAERGLNVTADIAGAVPVGVEQWLLGPGIELSGWVDDLETWYGGVDCTVLYATSGGGGRIKVFESLAHGVPVIVSERAAEGLPHALRDCVVVVEDVEGAVDALISMTEDPAPMRTAAEFGRQRVAESFGWSSTTAAYEQVLVEHRSQVWSGAGSALRTVWVLKSPDYRRVLVEAGTLPYRIDELHRVGWRPTWVDVRLVGRAARFARRAEALGVPLVQVVTGWRLGTESKAVLAMFESEGHGLALARRLGIARRHPPLVVVACWLTDLAAGSAARRRVYRWLYRAVDHVVVFSENQRPLLEEMLGLESQKVSVVRFGVDLEELASVQTSEAADVVAVGRDLGRDWATLLTASDGTDWEVDLVTRASQLPGDGIQRRHVREHGPMPRREYLALLAAATVVAIPTDVRHYPTGQTVLLEAMALGKACVVTDSPAMRDYAVHEETALLVPPHDPGAFHDAVERLRTDHRLRHRLGSTASAEQRKHGGSQAMWAEIGAVLDAQVANRGR